MTAFVHPDVRAELERCQLSPLQLLAAPVASPEPAGCCIVVKSSVLQGMILCFDERIWLVCRNSGDTEECRESVMK
jgi:hypothetical protein